MRSNYENKDICSILRNGPHHSFPSTFRKKMSVHCIKGYKICASDFASTDMKNMEARISGNVFWNHSQYVYLDPPNTPKMVDVRKLWSITQSFWIHTGIFIYIYIHIYIYIKRLLEADLLYHIHILRSRSAPKKSGIHGCRQGVFISTHDLTTFLHLGRTRKVCGTRKSGMANPLGS